MDYDTLKNEVTITFLGDYYPPKFDQLARDHIGNDQLEAVYERPDISVAHLKLSKKDIFVALKPDPDLNGNPRAIRVLFLVGDLTDRDLLKAYDKFIEHLAKINGLPVLMDLEHGALARYHEKRGFKPISTTYEFKKA